MDAPRTQAYKGKADWELLEKVAVDSPLPIIGNGDLHSPVLTKRRMAETRCQALMLGRGPLRDPFIFLTSYLDDPSESPFGPKDFKEIIRVYYNYLQEYNPLERSHLIQMRKMIVWFVAGFSKVAEFRGHMFAAQSLDEVFRLSDEFFDELDSRGKHAKRIDLEKPFMMGGHG